MQVRFLPGAPIYNKLRISMPTNDKQQFLRGIEVVGSAIIEDGEGKILLVKSPKWHNKWIMPGGHIEPGEKIVDAQLREAEEEVGLKLKYVDVIAFGELIGSKDFYRPAHFVYFNILCQTDNKNVKLDNEELTEYVWVEPEKALEMDLAGSYDETIKNYLKFKK
jgi:nucleoside triphosphatase